MYLMVIVIIFIEKQMTNKNYAKIHTFSMRPSPAQIGAYIVVSLQVCIFYILIRPSIKSQVASIILISLFSLSLVLLLCFSFLSSYIDPSDSVMILCKNGKKKQLDDKISELLYCDSCDTYVTKDAKHCRDCRRCVQNFDHHCMWINNCVGQKNYIPFILMITCTFFNFSVYLASVVVVSLEKQWYTFMGIIITIWVVMCIVFVLWFLLLSLNLLHLYLACKGYTTYQFIVARRQYQRRKQVEKRNKRLEEQQIKRKKILQQQNKRIKEQMQKQLQDNKKIENSKQHTQESIKVNKNQQQQRKTPQKIQNQQSTGSNIKLFNKEAQNLQTSDYALKNGGKGQNVIFDDAETQKPNGLKSQTIKIGDQRLKSQIAMSQQIQKKKDDGNFSESSSNQSIRMSSFFIRNKSYNFIFSNNSVISPHKKLGSSTIVPHGPIIQRQPIKINRNKSKSSLISNSNQSYQSVVKFPAKQLNKRK